MILASKAEAALDALELGVSSHADKMRCDTIRRRLREVETDAEMRERLRGSVVGDFTTADLFAAVIGSACEVGAKDLLATFWPLSVQLVLVTSLGSASRRELAEKVTSRVPEWLAAIVFSPNEYDAWFQERSTWRVRT